MAQGRPHLELQLRDASGRWVIIEAGTGQRLAITPLAVELEADGLYRDSIGV